MLSPRSGGEDPHDADAAADLCLADLPTAALVAKVEATARPHGGRWLAQGDVTVVEGAWPGSVVLTEFPDHAAAGNWYRSPEYQAILPKRLNNAIRRGPDPVIGAPSAPRHRRALTVRRRQREVNTDFGMYPVTTCVLSTTSLTW